jgi:NAD(P)-dependent dehydrogenase (short-subunit alcohol dehydrogenase family)
MKMATLSPWTIYGISQLANLLHAKELAKRYGEMSILAVSLHPGTVKTGLAMGPRGSSLWYKYLQPLVEMGAPGPERGCWGVLWCAASEELRFQENGGYFEGVGRVGKTKGSADNHDMARRLWEWSDEAVRQSGL